MRRDALILCENLPKRCMRIALKLLAICLHFIYILFVEFGLDAHGCLSLQLN